MFYWGVSGSRSLEMRHIHKKQALGVPRVPGGVADTVVCGVGFHPMVLGMETGASHILGRCCPVTLLQAMFSCCWFLYQVVCFTYLPRTVAPMCWTWLCAGDRCSQLFGNNYVVHMLLSWNTFHVLWRMQYHCPRQVFCLLDCLTYHILWSFS